MTGVALDAGPVARLGNKIRFIDSLLRLARRYSGSKVAKVTIQTKGLMYQHEQCFMESYRKAMARYVVWVSERWYKKTSKGPTWVTGI